MKAPKPDAGRDAVNAERANRPAPEFLNEKGRKDWQSLAEGTRIYIWRRLDELHAAPLRCEAKLAKSLGFPAMGAFQRFQQDLAPFMQHAALREMALSDYLAFFAGSEAKARDGNMTGAIQDLLQFIGLNSEKLGRGMLAASATLLLPSLNDAFEQVLASFSARAIERDAAVQAVLDLLSAGHGIGIALKPDASSFELAEVT